MEKSKVKEIFTELGFEEDDEYKGLFTHKDLPFLEMFNDHNLLAISTNLEYRFDGMKIPFTKENIENIIKAFNPKIS